MSTFEAVTINSSMEEGDERVYFLKKDSSTARINDRGDRNERLWKLFAILFFVLFVLQTGLMVIWASSKSETDTYEAGFDTDLRSFKSSTKLVKTRFTSALHSDENGDLFLAQDPNEQKFVGGPIEEVDQNWENLISGLEKSPLPTNREEAAWLISATLPGRYFRFSDAEKEPLDNFGRKAAIQAPNPITQIFNSRGLFGGIDMFHSLHCLDSLRRATNHRAETQYQALQANFTQLHLGHCVEQLRQAILCHGDLTPVTLTPVFHQERKILNLVGQTEYPHTCRNWTRFQKLLHERDSLEVSGP